MDSTHDCWTVTTGSARRLSQIGVGTAAPRNEPAPAVTFSVGGDHATVAFTRVF